MEAGGPLQTAIHFYNASVLALQAGAKTTKPFLYPKDCSPTQLQPPSQRQSIMLSPRPNAPDTPCPSGNTARRWARSQRHLPRERPAASSPKDTSKTNLPVLVQADITAANVAPTLAVAQGERGANSRLSSAFMQPSMQHWSQTNIYEGAMQVPNGGILGPFDYLLAGQASQQQQTNFVGQNNPILNPQMAHQVNFRPATSLPHQPDHLFAAPGSFAQISFVSSGVVPSHEILGAPMLGRTDRRRGSSSEHDAHPAHEGGGHPGPELSQPAHNSGPSQELQLLTPLRQDSRNGFAGGPIIAPQPRRNVLNDFMPVASQTHCTSAIDPASMNQSTPFFSDLAAKFLQTPVAQVTPGTAQGPCLDLSQRSFQDSAAARHHLNQNHWRPITKSYGVPQTENERLPYVKKIYDAMINVSRVDDEEYFATDKQCFDARLGVWGTDPKSVEAIAHEVVDKCIHIHNHGVTGLALQRLPHLQLPNDHSDRVWTFAQRIHLMSTIVRSFKFCANHVMNSFFTMQYLARPWSTLMDQPAFVHRWNASTLESQIAFYITQPYIGMPAQHPTHAEVAQFQLEWQQEVQQRQQRVLQAQQQAQQQRQQQQVRQRHAIQLQYQHQHQDQVNAPPAFNVGARAQQLVQQQEDKRRRLNDSSNQPASSPPHNQQTQTSSLPLKKEASGSDVALDDYELPTQKPDIDWDQIFRMNGKYEMSSDKMERYWRKQDAREDEEDNITDNQFQNQGSRMNETSEWDNVGMEVFFKEEEIEEGRDGESVPEEKEEEVQDQGDADAHQAGRTVGKAERVQGSGAERAEDSDHEMEG
ncbi:hypothetical protein DE146DRAFT_753118 [Phaeosphaeria sp. MPI-PUGE-AT-0046c]|nr:hypothetical protein DE146DRAFT_753118 [Phaeosphaeria sp. MPI-PUGE-AT-0046c]